MDILKRIVELRVQRGWSEYELAKRAGLPQSTVSSWYRKNMSPSMMSLEKICNGFEITLGQLVTGEIDTDILSESQQQLLIKYNMLTESQREKLLVFIDGMLVK